MQHNETYLPSSLSLSDLGLHAGTRPLGKQSRRGRTSSYPGMFASTKCLGPAVFDSLLERDFQTILSADPRVAAYAVQAHQLTYWTPVQGGVFKQRRYTPDVVLRRTDGHMMIFEVKAEVFVHGAYWREREPYIRKAYRQDHAVDFAVVTERIIRIQPRLSNYQRMLRFGARFSDQAAFTAVRDVLYGAVSPNTLGDVCMAAALSDNRMPRAYAALMALALKGEITLELDRPLSPATLILRRHDS